MVVREQVASGELAAGGYVGADNRPSPWLAVLQQATRQVSTYSRMLRLNPSARVLAKSPDERPTPISYYERLALEAKRRDDKPEPH